MHGSSYMSMHSGEAGPLSIEDDDDAMNSPRIARCSGELPTCPNCHALACFEDADVLWDVTPRPVPGPQPDEAFHCMIEFGQCGICGTLLARGTASFMAGDFADVVDDLRFRTTTTRLGTFAISTGAGSSERSWLAWRFATARGPMTHHVLPVVACSDSDAERRSVVESIVAHWDDMRAVNRTLD